MEAIERVDGHMTQDPATLDQLRVLLAIAETGSFSAAGRRLHRVQSAVSHAVGAVETQLGAPLFVRGAGRPRWTPAGEAVLAIARDVCARADALRRLADALRRGEEPVLGVAVEVIYPGRALATACREFADAWPAVQLRLHTDVLGAVAELVRDGSCAFGVVGPAADTHGLAVRNLGTVRMVTVVSPRHPLAAAGEPLATERLAEEIQVVVSERSVTEETPDQAVLSPRTWRVHDLQTKRGLLCEGLGWGNLPEQMVDEDLVAGRLVRIRPAAWPADGLAVPLAVVTRADVELGPAGRWLVERLAKGCGVRVD
jgi:DNA-binding transcriptional LysR family regulator